MTKLLIIRHGQSEANLQGVFVGHTNSPLSDLGKQQAEVTAEYIVSNFHVDAVYASDLERAFYTGKAVADRLGLSVTAVKGMREIFAGDWETVKFDTLSAEYGEPYQLWLRDIGLAHSCSSALPTPSAPLPKKTTAKPWWLQPMQLPSAPLCTIAAVCPCVK